MIRITRHAFPDCGEYTVWKHQYWATPMLSRFGRRKCKRAKLLFMLPVWPKIWIGVFWTFGKEWVE